jgi:hypothetical protein
MTALILELLPSLLLVAGGLALAVWAKGLKDQQSALVARLTAPAEKADKNESADGPNRSSASPSNVVNH